MAPRRWLASLFILLAPLLAGQDFPDPIPEAPMVSVIYFETGQIIYEKNPHRPHPPASLTKMISLYIFQKRIAQGQDNWRTLVPVLSETSAQAMPPRSSLMFLEEGHRVTLEELLLGLAVVSGNDASYTLARYLKPNVQEYIDEMNTQVRELGFDQMRFYDPSGYDERSSITARQMAEFCRLYIQEFPESLDRLHAPQTMTYPLDSNLPPGFRSDYGPIEQNNRNGLLRLWPGVDGLKTGYIEESGFNLAVTAEVGGRRVVAVILGLQADSIWRGVRLRDAVGGRLLDFVYGDFDWIVPPRFALPIDALELEGELVLVPENTSGIPVHYSLQESLQWELDFPSSIQGQPHTGQAIGYARMVDQSGTIIHQLPLVPREIPPYTNWFFWLWDQIRGFFLWLGGAEPMRVQAI
jgi:D-alanyl-D-alanine carboxypeptidase (penicillin-binding protein 5/6)